MLESGFYNMDCMEGMRQFPDKFFDLAIVDPPYGIQVAKAGKVVGGDTDHLAAKLHHVYGESKKAAARQNFTTPSTTAVRRTKVTLKSLSA